MINTHMKELMCGRSLLRMEYEEALGLFIVVIRLFILSLVLITAPQILSHSEPLFLCVEIKGRKEEEGKKIII